MKKTLIFLIDAVNPKQITKETAPFLHTLKKKNYAKIKTLLGYSIGIHPSIWIGKYQPDHGVFVTFSRDEKNSSFKWANSLRVIPSFIRKYILSILKLPYYTLEKLRTKWSKWYIEKIIHYPPLLPPEIAYHFVHGDMNPKGDSLFDILKRRKISFSTQTDVENYFFENIIPLEKFEITDKKIDFYYIYEPDGKGHLFGPYSKEIGKVIKKIDNKIKELYEKALNKYGDVDIIIFSDHGMCEIKHFVDVKSYFDKAGLINGKDYLAFYNSTIVQLWVLNKKREDEILKVSKKMKHATLLDKKLLKKYHLDGLNKYKYGEYFILADPETRIYPDYFAPVKVGIKGWHGFSPDFEDSYGIFISNFKINKKIIDIIDLLPIFLWRLINSKPYK